MGPIGHFSVGLAAKPAVPKVPLGVLLLATWILDVLAIVLGFAGIERGGSTGLSLSHGLFMSVIWSLVAAFLAARIYRDHRAGVVVGLLVFSHWVLDFVSHPIPFPSFSWRSWQWSYGHPLRPIFHFSSAAHRKSDSACTTPSVQSKPRDWSLECSFWGAQSTRCTFSRREKLEDHTLHESEMNK